MNESNTAFTAGSGATKQELGGEWTCKFQCCHTFLNWNWDWLMAINISLGSTFIFITCLKCIVPCVFVHTFFFNMKDTLTRLTFTMLCPNYLNSWPFFGILLKISREINTKMKPEMHLQLFVFGILLVQIRVKLFTFHQFVFKCSAVSKNIILCFGVFFSPRKHDWINSICLWNGTWWGKSSSATATIVDYDLLPVRSHPSFKCKSAEWRLFNICLESRVNEVQLWSSHALTGDNPQLKINRIFKM